ncbi:hypothetical protein QU670_12605 [Actinomyces massiliensis]|uniref:Uncharacterized protein n=1 Tax=Actinomyces massiliensis F0489 TaxID=1125718 RepID=J1HCY0_9ACTO|nr:hypothetical protein [Actinomyces massiliensis]EJF43253.1 hypothetical protein HMPREF1318_1870 [Actinomyces massiliensis F0489]WLD71282.1 hypothetical protein QU670_12605 [Actinomyces massiliensis]
MAAFEAASDSLRREVASQGIQVVIVQLGGVQTPMADRSGPLSHEIADSLNAEHKALYGPLISRTVATQTSFLQHAIPAERAAAKIVKVATLKRPRPRYSLGMDAAFTLPLNCILPTRLMDRVLTR